jgi:hypothetical protein
VADALVDTSKFTFKTRRVKAVFAAAAAKELLLAAQKVYKGSAENLKGPGIPKSTSSGGRQYPDYSKILGYDRRYMPIGRVTGTLARSLKLTPLSSISYAIWADPKIASYAKYVHDGTKYTYPRRFIYDVVNKERAGISSHLNKVLKAAIASEGQK